MQQSLISIGKSRQEPYMSLANFIANKEEQILVEWDVFAASHSPAGAALELSELRDHASEILQAIVLDLNTGQSASERDQKSKGYGVKIGTSHTAAETHAVLRAKSGFSIMQMAAEYRALRASVLKLWSAAVHDANTDYQMAIMEVGRFNEAIDQALMESVTFFTQEFERNRNLFLAVVGHDLRNPLMAILSATQSLTKLGLEGKGAESVSRLTRGSERIKNLLDDLLDYNRAALGSLLPIKVTNGDLRDICESEIDGLQCVHKDRVIRFFCHGDLRGTWDGLRIQQLLSNLLKNALDYGACEEAIEVRATGRDEAVLLSVHNRGKPIPPAALPHIFAPLTRGNSDHSHAPSTNLGLGLFITQEIARAHGGSMHVTSDEHETIFTLQLPR